MQCAMRDSQAQKATHQTHGKQEVVACVVMVAAVEKVEVKVARVPILDGYKDTPHLEKVQVHTPHPPDQHRGLRGAHKCEQANRGC